MFDLYGKIKSILPVSSRSFHSFERRMLDQAAEFSVLRQENQELRQLLLRVLDEHSYEQERDMMLYWHLAKNVDRSHPASSEEAKLNFFRGLSRPRGTEKLFQDNLVKLLCDFDSLCRDCGISYFAGSGTLLGAYLYNDIIPWDDDVDVFVFRNDISRICQVAKVGGVFRVTERWDRRCACRQIRFRLSDYDNPAFIDLFPLDLIDCDSPHSAWKEYLDVRDDFISNFFKLVDDPSFPDDSWPYVDASSAAGQMIESVYQSTLNGYGPEVSFVDDLTCANALLRGIDNINESRSTGPWPLNDWLPTIDMHMREFDVMVPCGWRTYLDRHYGDFFIIPKDMHGHQHVKSSSMNSQAALKSMDGYLRE